MRTERAWAAILTLACALAGCGGSGATAPTPDADAGAPADAAADASAGADSSDAGAPDAGSRDAGTAAPDGPATPMPTSLALLAGGLGGPGFADGTGPAVRFYGSQGVASDGAGNLFIADTDNHVIRKLVVATGAVSTLAGAPGASGSDDGTGSAARFFLPSGIAADGAGNLFVTDTANETIRKIVVATGAVTTFAGMVGAFGGADGTGLGASFQQPTGIASDGAGNLFVADSSNGTIRRIVVATGAVTTLAGTAGSAGAADGTGPAASFRHPQGVAADGAGNVFVGDTENHRIRKIVVATRAVTTLAGSLTELEAGSDDGTGRAAKFDHPEGLVSDRAGNLFVADTYNQTIRKIAVASGAVTTLAGTPMIFDGTDGVGAAARFTYPECLAADGAGNLFVAGSAVRKIVIATATVSTVAGAEQLIGAADGAAAAARFFSPAGVVTDGAGNAFVADSSNNTVRKIVLATGAVTTLAGTTGAGSSDGTGTAAGFYGLSGVTADGAGTLFVADTFNSTIREIVAGTGAVTTLAGSPGLSGSDDGTGPDAQLDSPEGLAADGAGNLFVADSLNNTIRKVVIATGAVTTLAGSAGEVGSDDGTGAGARFDRPSDIAFDGAGNLFVADTFNHTIRKIVVATGAVTTLAGSAENPGSFDGVATDARFAYPAALASDRAGHLFVADTENHAVRRIVVATGAVTTLIGASDRAAVVPGPLPASLNRPSGIAVDRATGALIITDENAVLIAR